MILWAQISIPPKCFLSNKVKGESNHVHAVVRVLIRESES